VEQPELSSAASATTWVWGDTTGDGDAQIDDVTRVVDAANGNFSGGTTISQVDLAPCTPNGVVNTQDISAALDASSGIPFPCDPPCLVFTLAAMADFVACLDGPAVPRSAECADFDFDEGGTADLLDFGHAQLIFTSP
jgi:hypothetical protein